MKIVLFGILGKMGRSIVNCVEQSSDDEIVAGVDKIETYLNCLPVFYENKKNNVKNSIPVYTQAQDIYEEFDVIIDFSSPSLSSQALHLALLRKKPIVIGTTGHSNEQIVSIQKAHTCIPVCFLPNMSSGFSLLMLALNSILCQINSGDFDFAITEKHHKNKLDAPSGSALTIKNLISDNNHSVQTHSFRMGNAIGEHSVLIENDLETIEIKHIAHSRNAFALGAINQARNLVENSIKH